MIKSIIDNVTAMRISIILICDKLYGNSNVIKDIIKRFSNHDDELKQWLITNLIYGGNSIVLEKVEFRKALTKDFVSSVLEEKHKKYFENLEYEANRAKGGMMVVSIFQDGRRESWLEKEQKTLANFVKIKTKILSYFNKSDDEDTQKKTYRTKF